MDPRCRRSPSSKFYIVAIGPSNVTPIARWQTGVGGIWSIGAHSACTQKSPKQIPRSAPFGCAQGKWDDTLRN